MEKKIIITVPEYGDHRFKSWAKLLTGVDRSKTNGYCFEGSFISQKAEVPVGSYLLLYGRFGSMKYNDPAVRVLRVNEDGSLEKVYEKQCETEKWALETRDEIASIIESSKSQEESTQENRPITQENTQKENASDLSRFSLQELEAEIMRRRSDWWNAMIYTVECPLYGKLTFSRPCGKYIYVDVKDQPNILGKNICKNGLIDGENAITYEGDSYDEFKRICDDWLANHLETKKIK